jgi:hypothetical protein
MSTEYFLNTRTIYSTTKMTPQTVRPPQNLCFPPKKWTVCHSVTFGPSIIFATYGCYILQPVTTGLVPVHIVATQSCWKYLKNCRDFEAGLIGVNFPHWQIPHIVEKCWKSGQPFCSWCLNIFKSNLFKISCLNSFFN